MVKWRSGRGRPLRLVEKLVLPAKSPAELLTLPGLVVLEPVEHVFALYLAVEREVCCYLLDLGGIRGSHPTPVHLL